MYNPIEITSYEIMTNGHNCTIHVWGFWWMFRYYKFTVVYHSENHGSQNKYAGLTPTKLVKYGM